MSLHAILSPTTAHSQGGDVARNPMAPFGLSPTRQRPEAVHPLQHPRDCARTSPPLAKPCCNRSCTGMPWDASDLATGAETPWEVSLLFPGIASLLAFWVPGICPGRACGGDFSFSSALHPPICSEVGSFAARFWGFRGQARAATPARIVQFSTTGLGRRPISAAHHNHPRARQPLVRPLLSSPPRPIMPQIHPTRLSLLQENPRRTN